MLLKGFGHHVIASLLIGCLLVPCVLLEICELTDDLSSCYKKFLSFEAIEHIHKYLDNDKNGEVDSSEAAKFVHNEFSPTERARKPRSLTTEDPLVSLTDLWTMWKRNPAFNWTVKQVVKWLSDSVDLPQYQEIFVRHSVDGKALPLLAMQNMSYLTNVLLIQNPIEKRKIMLKALDTILFGPPQKQPFISPKASLITASCGVAFLIIFCLSHWHFNNSSGIGAAGLSSDCSSHTEQGLRQLQLRLDDLEHLRYMLNSREDYTDVRSKWTLPVNPKQSIDTSAPSLHDRPMRRPMFHLGDSLRTTDKNDYGTRTSIADERQDEEHFPVNLSSESVSLGNSISNLTDMEPLRQCPMTDSNLRTSTELMLWLQLTYELETQQYAHKKAEAEAQLNAARHACKRLNRKRYNILGSVRLLHTDSLDELEFSLVQAKRVLEQLQTELEERVKRWTRIEALTGFRLRSNPGLVQLRNVLATHFPNSPLTDNLTFPPTVLEAPSVQTTSDSGTSASLKMSDVGSAAESVDSVGPRLLDVNRRHHGSLVGTKSSVPRTYSFVRHFANVWRRKAGSRSIQRASSTLNK